MQPPLEQHKLEQILKRMPHASAPPDLWDNVQRNLRESPRRKWIQQLQRPVRSPVLAAAAIVVAVGVGLYVGTIRTFNSPMTWDIVPVAGSPRVAGDILGVPGNIAKGQWLVTDEQSRALISVGRIGTAEVGPSSRVRLDSSRGREHRLTLERGTLNAVIAAPPRLFFVSTPTTLATDLGCAYTLSVEGTGATRIHVTSGWVELGEGSTRALVPAGFVARVAVGGEPGTPFTNDLAPQAQEILRTLDLGLGDSATVAQLIDQLPVPSTDPYVRKDAAITLWHLLQRLDVELRELVIDGMIALSPPPSGVTREGVLALERPMLERWRRDLRPMWSEEAQPLLVRMARRLWDWTMS